MVGTDGEARVDENKGMQRPQDQLAGKGRPNAAQKALKLQG